MGSQLQGIKRRRLFLKEIAQTYSRLINKHLRIHQLLCLK